MTVRQTGNLTSVLNKFARIEKRVEDLMNLYFDNLDKMNPMFVKRINVLSFLSKVVEINSHFLKIFVDTYNIDEPVLSTALARGIFELHLILLEATSSDEGFVRVLTGSGDAYESYIQMFRQIAKEKGDVIAVNTINRELERISLHKERFEALLKANLKGKGKLKPYVRFDKLASKHGLSEVYDFEYRLLSFFLHPTFLYLLTTRPKDKKVSKQMRDLALLNVKQRKLLVKSVATRVASAVSSRTIAHIERILNDPGLHPGHS